MQYHEEKLHNEVFMLKTDNEIKKLIAVLENHYSSEFYHAK